MIVIGNLTIVRLLWVIYSIHSSDLYLRTQSDLFSVLVPLSTGLCTHMTPLVIHR